jgi:2-polyprenyl-6-methoxyphenol hydroxylase-like FAD-dependent oxidoreductase
MHANAVRTIGIVGGGQAGLQLAFGLRRAGYAVTVVTDRDAEQVRRGRVLSTQCMFDDALQIERRLGLDQWRSDAPQIKGFHITFCSPDGGRELEWTGRLSHSAQSVDQRLKLSAWLEELEADGARVVIADCRVRDLEELADRHDLVVVATGRNGMAGLFERDPARSPYEAPQRALAVAYVQGIRPQDQRLTVNVHIVPAVGELFQIPCLSPGGASEALFFEAVPGGPMDVFDLAEGPESHLRRSRELTEAFFPWESERISRARLADPCATLAGRFVPTVRRPVGRLPSGRPVFGLADAVVLNDPITGQGSNSAAKAAEVYLRAILARGAAAFDEDWMVETFERAWQYLGPVTQWTNMFLGPPPEHVEALMAAASRSGDIAGRIADGFNDPPALLPYWQSAALTERLITGAQAARA